MVVHQDYSTISGSAPALSMSSDRSESLAKSHERHQGQREEAGRQFKKHNPGKVTKAQSLSPGSALSLRRSPRFKVLSLVFVATCFPGLDLVGALEEVFFVLFVNIDSIGAETF